MKESLFVVLVIAGVISLLGSIIWIGGALPLCDRNVGYLSPNQLKECGIILDHGRS